jgi:hypothetical protein
LSISVACPKCAHSLKAKDGLAGKKVMCPKCQAVIVVPAAKVASVAATPSTPSRSTASSPAARAAAIPTAPAITTEQLAAAFTGKIELPKVSTIRRMGTWLVLVVLLLLVVLYLAILGGLACAVYWLATSEIESIPPAAVSLAMAAAAVLWLCLIRPLVMPEQRAAEVLPLPVDKHKLLADFVARIAELVNAPPPGAIQTE